MRYPKSNLVLNDYVNDYDLRSGSFPRVLLCPTMICLVPHAFALGHFRGAACLNSLSD